MMWQEIIIICLDPSLQIYYQALICKYVQATALESQLNPPLGLVFYHLVPHRHVTSDGIMTKR